MLRAGSTVHWPWGDRDAIIYKTPLGMFRELSEATEKGGGLAWIGAPRILAYSRKRLLHLSSGLAHGPQVSFEAPPLMCVFPCLCVYTDVSMHVKARGWHYVSSSIAVHFTFWGRISPRTWNPLIWLSCLPSELQGSSGFSALGLQVLADPAFVHGAGDLNWDPHDCMAITLSTELSLQPFLIRHT